MPTRTGTGHVDRQAGREDGQPPLLVGRPGETRPRGRGSGPPGARRRARGRCPTRCPPTSAAGRPGPGAARAAGRGRGPRSPRSPGRDAPRQRARTTRRTSYGTAQPSASNIRARTIPVNPQTSTPSTRERRGADGPAPPGVLDARAVVGVEEVRDRDAEHVDRLGVVDGRDLGRARPPRRDRGDQVVAHRDGQRRPGCRAPRRRTRRARPPRPPPAARPRAARRRRARAGRRGTRSARRGDPGRRSAAAAARRGRGRRPGAVGARAGARRARRRAPAPRPGGAAAGSSSTRAGSTRQSTPRAHRSTSSARAPRTLRRPGRSSASPDELPEGREHRLRRRDQAGQVLARRPRGSASTSSRESAPTMSGVASHRSSIPASSSGWNCRPSALPARNACTGVASVEASSVAPGGQVDGVGVPVQHGRAGCRARRAPGPRATTSTGANPISVAARRCRREPSASARSCMPEAHAEHGDVGVDGRREQRALGGQARVPGDVVGVHRAAHDDHAGHLVERRQPRRRRVSSTVRTRIGSVEPARDQPGALVRGVREHQDRTHAGHQPSGSGRPSS